MTEPTPIAFYNGESHVLSELKVPALDRAFQFGDAIYEVLRIYRGQPFLIDEHVSRLNRNLTTIGIALIPDIKAQIENNIATNEVEEGMVYVQVSRGHAPRAHSFHKLVIDPNFLIYSKVFKAHPAEHQAKSGISCMTHEDIRWGRCDIKSVNLLANCLIQSKAHELGFDEAIFIHNDHVSEGTSCNVFLVKNGIISTPNLSTKILPGTRRAFIIEQFKLSGHVVREREIHRSELYEADEVFITSSIKEALGVVKIDDTIISDGQVGRFAKLARSQILKNVSRT